MFCMQCGTQLPDGAKFCVSCGAQLGGASAMPVHGNVPANTGTKFVDAKCTNCGAKLEVNPNMKKASCSYCGAEFLVEQAINNYHVQLTGNMNIGQATINVQGANKDNLLARARAFEANEELDEALEYYNRVLDIDFNDSIAKEGIVRTKDKIENFLYFDEVVPGLFSDDKKQVRRNSLSLIDAKGKEDVYYFDKMKNPRVSMTCLQFEYPGKWTAVTIGGSKNKEILEFIQNALRGIIPPYHKF